MLHHTGPEHGNTLRYENRLKGFKHFNSGQGWLTLGREKLSLCLLSPLHLGVTSILSRRQSEFLNSCPASVADPWQGSEALGLGNNNVLNVSDAKEHCFPDTPHFRSERAISAISFNRSVCRCLVTFFTVRKEYGCVSEIFSDLTNTWECKYSALSPASGPYWSSDPGPATRSSSN